MEVHHAVNADSKRADRPYQGQGTGIIEMDRSSEAGRKDRQPFAAEADLGQMDTDSSPSADDSDAECPTRMSPNAIESSDVNAHGESGSLPQRIGRGVMSNVGRMLSFALSPDPPESRSAAAPGSARETVADSGTKTADVNRDRKKQKQARFLKIKQEHEHELGFLQHKNRDLQSQVRRLQQTLDSSEQAVGRQQQILHRLQQEVNSKNSQSYHRERLYEDKIKQLEEENDSFSDKVKLAHTAAKTIMKEHRSNVSSDDDVRGWFTARQQAWYEWAKENADRGCMVLLDTLGSDDRALLLSELGKVVAIKDGCLPESLSRTRRAPYILLHGLLANFICQAFESPLWLFQTLSSPAAADSQPNQRHISGSLMDHDVTMPPTSRSDGVLTKGISQDAGPPFGGPQYEQFTAMLYEDLVKLHPGKAHHWRALLVQTLSANPPPSGQEDKTHRSCTWDSRRQVYARHLVAKFFNGPAKLFLVDESRSTSSDAAERLAEELSAALNFAVELWSRRSYLRCLWLPEFLDSNGGVFDSSRNDMELHQAHRVEDPSDCDGRPISLVVQPSIISVGTEEGTGYDEITRVWTKATIWLEDAKNY